MSTPAPPPTRSTKLRPALRFVDESAMLGDLVALRGGHHAGGLWSLAQIAWHLGTAFPRPLTAATRAESDGITDAQRDRQARWDYYIAHVAPPPGFEAPPNLVPPAGVGDDAIDALNQLLNEISAFPSEYVHTAAGAMPIARAHGFLLAHGAHHLAYLAPTNSTEAAHG